MTGQGADMEGIKRDFVAGINLSEAELQRPARTWHPTSALAETRTSSSFWPAVCPIQLLPRRPPD